MGQINILKTDNPITPSENKNGMFISQDGKLKLVNEYGEQSEIGGNLQGSNFLIVLGNGSPTENAVELQTIYSSAKKMAPNNAALSVDNRIKILVGAGKYYFDRNVFSMDANFIDIVSLSGYRDVNIITESAIGIYVSAHDVLLRGISVGNKRFSIGDNLNNLICENCEGGNNSFGVNLKMLSGTFKNCIGGSESFGFKSEVSGLFENCEGGNDSFGGYGNASGTFINCKGAYGAFGGFGTASGTFENCLGTIYSFGSNGIASGLFKNCTGINYSFGCNGTASGTFINCISGADSFGNNAFDNTGAKLTGVLKYCTLTAGTFQTPTEEGKIIACIDGENKFHATINPA